MPRPGRYRLGVGWEASAGKRGAMTSASVPLPGQPRPREGDPPALKRVISRNMLLLFVIGDILGAGIYALVGEVGGRVGGAIWTSFLLAARPRARSRPAPTRSS